MNKTPTTLIIMDGFGLSNDTVGNAVRAANTPVLDGLFAEYAHTTLQASGLDVGLPAGQMGNSEVGHTNIGGGRVVFQDLPRITRSIEDGTFFENPAYNKAMDDCLEKGSALHLYGLHSTGGVHSTLDHLYALLKMAHIKGLKRVYIHAFLDGRDTPPTSGRDFVAKTMEKCKEIGVGKIATVMGRYYAMDRDKRWDRLENAYDALVYGEGVQDSDPIHAIEESYKNGVTDEFVEPIVCDKDGMISDNDSVIFFNYRPDRAREITRAFVDPAFDGFKREFFPLTYVCNTEYDATMPNVLVAFPRISVKNGLGEYLSKMGMTQLRIAETEKYAHVTFFFNGGVEDPYPGEDRVLVAIEGGSAPDLIMEGPERLVANWGAKGVMAPLNDLWTDDAKKDIYESVNSACHNDKGDYYEYPLCMTAHCMAVNMTKVKEVGADQYIDTDKHTWSTDGFLKTVDALYNGGYENVAAIYCAGQGGDQGTRAIINNMYGGTFTDAAHTKYTADSAENIKAIQTLHDTKGINFDASIAGGDEITLFRNGTLQMAFCWNIAQQANSDNNAAGLTNDGDEIFPMAFPTDSGDPKLCGGIWGFGIFDNGDEAKIEAARTFIDFIAADPDQVKDSVLASTYFPVRTSVGDIYADNEIMSEYSKFMAYLGDYYQITPGWATARTEWWNMLQRVGSGEDVETAVKTFVDNANAAAQA